MAITPAGPMWPLKTAQALPIQSAPIDKSSLTLRTTDFTLNYQFISVKMFTANRYPGREIKEAARANRYEIFITGELLLLRVRRSSSQRNHAELEIPGLETLRN
ncbi:MAG TPA: hypothetical protein VJN64_00230 [Terriglobales bacterium]|nr:hypothetical protein [Terriglobales bacterium]